MYHCINTLIILKLEKKTSDENKSERHHQLDEARMSGDERDTFYKNSVFVRFCELSLFPVVFFSLPFPFCTSQEGYHQTLVFLVFPISFRNF